MFCACEMQAHVGPEYKVLRPLSLSLITSKLMTLTCYLRLTQKY